MFSQNGGGGRAGLGLGHRQGLRRGARGPHLDRPRRGHGARDRLHRPVRRPLSRRRSEERRDQGARRRRRPIAAQGAADRPDGPGRRGARGAHAAQRPSTRSRWPIPDLVILDLGLPDIDGMEVCRRIREFSEVPIVVLSAYGDERRKVEALDAGADDFVTKPFGMAELEARLRVALRHCCRPQGEAATISQILECRRPRDRPRPPHGDPLGLAAAAHREGVRAPGLPGPPRRQGVHPSHDPQGRLGSGLRRRVQLRARLHPPAAQEVGRRRGPAAQDHPWRRLPAGGRTLIPGPRTNRAGCASGATPRSMAGVPSATTRDPATIPGTTDRPRKRRIKRAGPVDQDGIGADPGPLEGPRPTRSRQPLATAAVAPTPQWRWCHTSCLELGQGLVELQHVDIGRAEEARAACRWSAG